MLTDLAIPGKLITTDNNNTQFKDDSLVKLALKKARAQAMMQNKSRKGKFAIETSLQTLPSFDEYVRTTSIKKEGQTYGISLDCVGRTREVQFIKYHLLLYIYCSRIRHRYIIFAFCFV